MPSPCASRLALDRYLEAFWRRDVVVLGVAVDPSSMRTAWHNIPVEGSGLAAVSYTLVTDMDHRICERYGLTRMCGQFHSRGAFLIDSRGVVRYQAINDLPLEQEINALLRMIDTLRAPPSKYRTPRSGQARIGSGERANPIVY